MPCWTIVNVLENAICQSVKVTHNCVLSHQSHIYTEGKLAVFYRQIISILKIDWASKEMNILKSEPIRIMNIHKSVSYTNPNVGFIGNVALAGIQINCSSILVESPFLGTIQIGKVSWNVGFKCLRRRWWYWNSNVIRKIKTKAFIPPVWFHHSISPIQATIIRPSFFLHLIFQWPDRPRLRVMRISFMRVCGVLEIHWHGWDHVSSINK